MDQGMWGKQSGGTQQGRLPGPALSLQAHIHSGQTFPFQSKGVCMGRGRAVAGRAGRSTLCPPSLPASTAASPHLNLCPAPPTPCLQNPPAQPPKLTSWGWQVQKSTWRTDHPGAHDLLWGPSCGVSGLPQLQKGLPLPEPTCWQRRASVGLSHPCPDCWQPLSFCRSWGVSCPFGSATASPSLCLSKACHLCCVCSWPRNLLAEPKELRKSTFCYVRQLWLPFLVIWQ